jgi:hypothetical protein
MLWQLKKLSTNEALGEPQVLPENWGPIFGLSGVKDKLGDLAWVGLPDQGWFETTQASSDENHSAADIEWANAVSLLRSSDWAVLPDVPMTSNKKALWLEYRKVLREIKSQSGFPSDIQWPTSPV